jgi:hypothetical protein
MTQPSKLSTRSRSTPLLLDLRTAHDVDLVGVDNFRPLDNLPRRVPRNAVGTKPVSLARRTPARAEPRRAQGEQSRVSTPARVVLARVEMARFMSRFCRSWPLQTGLISSASLCGSASHAERDHRQSRRHPAATVSSTNGRAPKPGTAASATPVCRYLCQPGQLHTRRVEPAGGPHGEARARARSASGPGRERRAKPHLRDQFDPTGLTDRVDARGILIMRTNAFRGTRVAPTPGEVAGPAHGSPAFQMPHRHHRGTLCRVQNPPLSRRRTPGSPCA